MDEARKYKSRSENTEAIPEPSTAVTNSRNSQEGTSPIVSKKRTKIKDRKIGNEKTKKTAENLEDSSTSGEMNFPLTANMINVMAMNAIKYLNKPNGVLLEDIVTYIEETYDVNMKSYQSCVRQFLDVNVKNGILERIKGIVAEERFRITKSVSVKNVARNLFLKDGTSPSMRTLRDASRSFYEKEVSTPQKKSTKKKNETNPPVSEVLVDSSDQTSEGIGAAPEPSTEEVTKTPLLIENTASRKRTKSMKSKTENVKSETTITDTTKLKPGSASENKNLKRRAAHPPTAEMVMDSIKSLKKRTGVTVEDIAKHMEEKYQVNMKVLKSHVNRFLKKSVENGALEKLGRADAEGRYKMKKSQNVKKVSQKVKQVKSVTKKVAPKRRVKKNN